MNTIRRKVRTNNVQDRMIFYGPSVENGFDDELTLSDFKIDPKFLGKGGQGVVLLGEYIKNGHMYAIKRITKDFIRKKNMVESLRLEIKIMYSLDHPNIIKLYHNFEDNDYVYLVQELAEGGQIYESQIKKYGKVSDRKAVKYIQGLVQA